MLGFRANMSVTASFVILVFSFRPSGMNHLLRRILPWREKIMNQFIWGEVENGPGVCVDGGEEGAVS